MLTKEEKKKKIELEQKKKELKNKLRKLEIEDAKFVKLQTNTQSYKSKWGQKNKDYNKLPIPIPITREYPRIEETSNWKISIEDDGRKVTFESGCRPTLSEDFITNFNQFREVVEEWKKIKKK